VKPAGNVAALMEKNPPPRKSHATRLTQRQTQRRDKFWLFDRLLFSTDPDFENVVCLAHMPNPFSASYCSFVNFARRELPVRSLACARDPDAALGIVDHLRRRLLASSWLEPTGRRLLTTGKGWLALFKGEKPGLHHYCYSMANYDPADALARLKAAGLAPKHRGDRVYFDESTRHRMPARDYSSGSRARVAYREESHSRHDLNFTYRSGK
jgi:hypothetical protein